MRYSTVDPQLCGGDVRNNSLTTAKNGRNQTVDWGESTSSFVRRFWAAEEGQDIAEDPVMLAVILVLVIGTVRLIGTNTNNVFSSVASTMQ